MLECDYGVCRIQSLFDSLGSEAKGKVIGLGGDGRYFNKEAAQIIIKLAAGAGIKKASFSVAHDNRGSTVRIGHPWHALLSCVQRRDEQLVASALQSFADSAVLSCLQL